MQLPDKELLNRHIRLIKGKHLFDIEASSICNYHCSFCPRDSVKRTNEFMDLDMMEAVARWIPTDSTVMFSGMGECLLNKDLEYLVSLISSRNISTCIVSNGSLLKIDRLMSLIESGLDAVQISLVSLDQESYVKGMGTREQHRSLLQNLGEILKREKHLRIQINHITENRDETIQDFCRQHDISYFPRRVHSRGGLIKSFRKTISRNHCGIFASTTFITCDGDILHCVNDVSASSILGNVKELSFDGLIEKKIESINKCLWPTICNECTDDYRSFILLNEGFDIK